MKEIKFGIVVLLSVLVSFAWVIKYNNITEIIIYGCVYVISIGLNFCIKDLQKRITFSLFILGISYGMSLMYILSKRNDTFLICFVIVASIISLRYWIKLYNEWDVNYYRKNYHHIYLDIREDYYKENIKPYIHRLEGYDRGEEGVVFKLLTDATDAEKQYLKDKGQD